MKRNYYCTVSGLLDLEPDLKNLPASYSDIVSDINDILHEDDRNYLRTIRYQYDNSNLISLLKKDGRFDPKGNYTEEKLLLEIKNNETLPSYMTDFLEIYDESSDNLNGKIWDDILAENFYKYTQISDSEFVRKWFDFDFNLRNVITAINLRRSEGGSIEDALIGDNDVVATAIKNINLPDLGLASELPWITEIINIETDSLVEYEKIFDKIRWEFLDNLTTFSYFEVDTILAFCTKLGIVVRWLNLDDTMGKEKLSELLKELKSGVNFNS